MFLVWQNTIVNEHGDIQPGAFVEIKYQESGVNVQLYADSDGTTPVSNPVQADAQGFVRVYIRNEGRTLYRIRAFRNGFERIWENELIGVGEPRTAAELAAGVVPADFTKPPMDTVRYGSDPTAIGSVFKAVGSGARFRGHYEQITVVDGDTPIIEYDGEDHTGLSDAHLVGVGKGVGTAALINFKGELSANWMTLDHVIMSNCNVGVNLSAGWGHFFNGVQAINCGVGIQSTGSPITGGWSGSGYVNMNTYALNCNVGIRDTALWNATYINPIFERCETPYIQTQNGISTVMINPWFEANTNPPQWRRSSIVIGGRDVSFTDVNLFAGTPADSIIHLARDGIYVFRNINDIQFLVQGNGVKRFNGDLNEIGFTAYRFNNEAGGLMIDAHVGDSNHRGIFARLNTQPTTTDAERVGLALTNFSTFFFNALTPQIEANNPTSQIRLMGTRSAANGGTSAGQIQFHIGSHSQNGGPVPAVGICEVVSTGFNPLTDNAYSLGSASFRWSEIFAAVGTINTSDREVKQDIRSLDEKERAVAVRLKSLIRAYRYKDAVANKGDAARIHVGVIAQEVAQAFAAEGLDASRYGLFCYDEWYEIDGQVVEVDENGDHIDFYYELDGERVEPDKDGNLPERAERIEIRTPAERKGRYGIRYDELLAFVIAAL